MKTIALLFLFASVIGHGAGLASQADTSIHTPCFDLKAFPASEGDVAALKGILDSLHVDLHIFLYVSHDSKMKDYGGAVSFKCKGDDHEIYDTDENWIIYDPDLIQGDLPRDFVLAHEVAHHMDGDTSSAQPRSRELELRADYNGTKYLLQMGWSKARLLHALDLLNLPQGPQLGYPTREEREKIVLDATQPPRPGAPTNLRAVVDAGRPPSHEVFWGRLLNLSYLGPARFQSVRTGKYLCAIGTPDPRIPSTRHFTFFDNCEPDSRASFDLMTSLDGRSGYWLLQHEEPCPEFAANCQYALQSVENQLQFWNQNLASDGPQWERELGEEELFTFEVSDISGGLVRIKNHKEGFVFVDPKTAQLRSGGTREQAAEFAVLFESN
jgi:hypothetical protein